MHPASGGEADLEWHEWCDGCAPAGAATFPLELTSFVGRRTELSEVKRLQSTARLVTLTGVGGVGKTRLALRAAAGARREFPDGVWLVELGDLRDGSLVADVVGRRSLGVRDQSGRPVRGILGEFLAAGAAAGARQL